MREEFPTIVLIVMCYLGFGAITLLAGENSGPVAIAGLALVLTLYSSLQHEVIHGHPFQSQWLNDALVFPAFGVFVPYQRFKETHLAHHYDPNLTDPYEDPETNFIDVLEWNKMAAWSKTFHLMNATLLGRMVFGPIISLATFYRSDIRCILSGNTGVLWGHALHCMGLLMCVLWVLLVADFAVWQWVLSAYLAMSILKIRTYLEHRAHERAAARSVIIEDQGPLAFLFLNNNYHAVHHAHPKVAWHQLPSLFDRKREHFLARNKGYCYPSYASVFKNHLIAPKDDPVHPFWSKDPDLLSHRSLQSSEDYPVDSAKLTGLEKIT